MNMRRFIFFLIVCEFFSLACIAANKTIKGHIVDEFGKNVEFASVYVDSIYAVSDKEGNPDSHFYRNHELTVLGKRKNITKQDLMLFAQKQDIRNASNIIEEVEDVVMNFKSYAEKVEIDEHWIRKIERVLEEIRK